MSVESMYSANEAAILSRLIDPEMPSLAPEAARAMLKLDFALRDRERMVVLEAKSSDGLLSPQERAEMESYNHVGHILALLQSKARLSLKKA